MTRRALLAVALVVSGCRTEPPPSPTPTASASPPLVAKAPYPAPHLAPARFAYTGGAFLRAPRVVTMTFAADDRATVERLERFGDVVTTTEWWKTVTRDRCAAPGDCIGTGAGGGHVRLADTLTRDVTTADLALLLLRALDDGRAPRPTADSLYLLYLPPGIRPVGIAPFCEPSAPRAYHANLGPVSGTDVTPAFAVVVRCSDESEAVAAASHEILEAVGNPHPGVARGGFQLELRAGATDAFGAAGLELVDPCVLVTQNDNRTFESGYVLQRAWSDTAAAAGHDPCVPSRPGRYVGAAPDRYEIQINEGHPEERLTLTAFSDEPGADFALSAHDLTEVRGGVRTVDLDLDRHVVNNGTEVHLKVTYRQRPPGAVWLTTVAIVATVGVRSSMWPLRVTMPKAPARNPQPKGSSS